MASETWDIGDALGNLSFTDLANLLSQYRRITGNASPDDYLGGGALQYPGARDYYNSLVQMGLPPAVAASIATQSDYAEDERQHQGSSAGWPYQYAGRDQELAGLQAGHPGREEALSDQVWRSIQSQQENFPRTEGQTPGPNDAIMGSGSFLQLPTGQYVPTPPTTSTESMAQMLSRYQSYGNPQSFWWNPQPQSYWGNLLSGGQ